MGLDSSYHEIIPVEDRPEEDIKQYFDQCFSFINEGVAAKQNVVVHCEYGMSRSATIVIAYLMETKGVKLDTARAFVQSKRPCILPNAGFILQLQMFEEELREQGKIL
jgi:protein-tyrosine phosphatase